MQTFDEIHDHEVRELHRGILFLGAFIAAAAVIIGGIASALAG